MPSRPRLFISYIPDRDHFVALEYGRSPEGQLPGTWQNVGESAAFLHDGPGGPIVGFGLDEFSVADLDAPGYAPLWNGPRFTAPLVGLAEASAGEIVLAARTFLAGRPTLNRRIFDAAVDAQSEDRHVSLGRWLDCLESGDAMAHFAVGYSLYELGSLHEAYRHLRHYAEIAPGTAWNWRWYGRAAEAIGETGEAVRAYERAVDLGDEDTDADSLLRALFEREGTIDLERAGAGYDRLPMATEDASALGERFEDALAFAARVHRDQRRKGTAIPYVGHLLGVCSLVIEDGGSEDEAIAALLHDAVEDQGGDAMLEQIRARYGSAVADIVRACSDTTQTPKPPWRGRKEAYLAHLADAPPCVLRVSLADKLYNARAILRDHELEGERLWGRFDASSGRDGQLWYYGELAERFSELSPGPMARELAEVVDRLRADALST